MQKKEDVESIADLACLDLDASQKPVFQDHLKKIVESFQVLETLETQEVEPMVTPHNLAVSLRKDQVQADLSVDDLMENAPDAKDALFKVPPVVS